VSEDSHGDAWFTKADIGGFNKGLQTTLDREFSPWLLGVEIPTLANLSGFTIAANLIADIGRADKLAGAAQLLLYGAVAYEFTLAAGYIYMQHVMEADVAQQETAVLD